MVRIENILCPVDFYPASQRALEYAIALARNYEARLHILHVAAPLPAGAYKYAIDTVSLIRSSEQEALRHLDKMAKPAKAAGVPVVTAVRTGDIDAELKRGVELYKADLVVMGTHGRRGFERWFLGSVTERLLRHLPVPILTLAATKETESVPPAIKHILVTTDFSEGSADAMSYALSLAQESQARVTLLHVLDDPAGEIPDRYRAVLLRGIREQLQEMVPDEVRNWCEVTTEVEVGVPYRRILTLAAERSVDLLVMNIHGKGMLDRALLGVTAERVIRAAPCPVLAIPPRSA
ncbi:MAG: universal stress protein [Acidobacteria bacterium]|nr:universal stress protein [Acidobacteriota bacterium]